MPDVIVPTVERFERVVTDCIDEVAFSTLPLLRLAKLSFIVVREALIVSVPAIVVMV